MKYAGYLLGDLDARDVALENRPLVAAALEGHYFQPYLPRLRDALRNLFETFGAWAEEALFAVIGDIVDDVAGEGGVYMTKSGPGLVNIRVPFRLETIF